MIDIYDEMGHIKEVLEHGTTPKHWERDGRLLARYYRDLGMKKSEVKKIIKEKCAKYGGEGYDSNVNYKRVNNFVDKIFKKDKDGNYKDKIREIKEVVITQDVVDWFLGLETSFELTDEQIELEKQRRPKVSVKRFPMNFNRIKYLFTLYIWTKVQENYLDRPNVHYLKKYNKRFKEDADLKQAFNMTNERNFLYDLGFIDINHAIGIIVTFIDKYDVFKIPVTEENKVILTGEDMYKCGYWLLKQKMGSFVCQNCGREFAYYTNSKNERKTRKYCKDCANLLGYNKHPNKKEKDIALCTICGKWKTIETIDGKIPNPFICEKCKKDIFRSEKTEYMREYRKTSCNHE